MASNSPVCNSLACNTFTRSVLETFSLIRNLCKNEGYCFASNKALATMRKVSKATITRHIQELVTAGLFVWQKIGRERHLTPSASKKMTRVCVESAPGMQTTHAGAANQQTKETKETFRENKQQTAAAPESSSACPAASPVVASSAKAFPERTSPEGKQAEPKERSASGFASIASILQAIPETNRAESPGTAQARAEVSGEASTPTGTRPPSPVAALPEGKPEAAAPEVKQAGAAIAAPGEAAAPVADLEIVRALHRRAGMGLRAAQKWAAKQPAECRRLLAIALEKADIRNKAAWIIAALRDAEAGNSYAFAAPPAPKAPPKAAPEGETERRQQKRLADVEASEKASQAQYEAIPEPERAQWEAQAVANLTGFMRKRWNEGKGDAQQIVRAAVAQLWRQQAANVGAS